MLKNIISMLKCKKKHAEMQWFCSNKTSNDQIEKQQHTCGGIEIIAARQHLKKSIKQKSSMFHRNTSTNTRERERELCARIFVRIKLTVGSRNGGRVAEGTQRSKFDETEHVDAEESVWWTSRRVSNSH